jgi:general secretion pathway protein L
VRSGETLLVRSSRGGGLGEWLLVGDEGVAARGDDFAQAPKGSRTVLAVPGERTALHWLDLGPELTGAQAAAAARLMVAERCAQPVADIHVAVGPAQDGRRCVALVAKAEVEQWLMEASAAGLEPDSVLPDMLLLASDAKLVRRDEGGFALCRGPEVGFAAEPELADAICGPAVALDERRFEAGLARAIADAPVDLRQGPFARRRQWRAEGGVVRRLGLASLALLILTLAVELAAIYRYTAAASGAEEETRKLTERASPRRLAALGGGGFSGTASALFEAIRATPGAELSLLVYEPDGVLRATVQADSAVVVESVRERLLARGFTAAAGAGRSSGGRHSADLTVSP